MLEKPLKLMKISFSLASFICSFYVILELTYFLSFPKSFIKSRTVDPWVDTSRVLLNNCFLLTVFIIQHSAMASDRFKTLLANWGLQDLTRSIYITATTAALWLTINYWQTASHFILWDLDISYKPILYLYIGTHVVVWAIIYVANVCTDVTELLGLKQIYYSINNLPDPNRRKSYQLQKLTAHMRHPSFLGFLIIFWFFPLMTLDRLLLASILTLYMYIAWNTDGEDYNYQKYMYQRKYHELQRIRNY